jgi:hypothetical protein
MLITLRRSEHLNGDSAANRRILRAIYDPHPARADDVKDRVLPDLSS